MQKSPAGDISASGGTYVQENSGLAVLTVKDLGCCLDEQHSAHHSDERLRQHIAGVVHEAVGPGAQTLIQVAPDEDAGQEAAHEAQEACDGRTDGHADHPVLEGAGEELCGTQSHKGHQIVQQNLTEEIEEGGRRGCPEAQKHLQAAVHQTGEQTPLDAVAEGDKIVTSSISDKYLPGILIGYVSEITLDSNKLTKSGTVIPAVDFEHLEEVLVILKLKQTVTE